MIIKKASTANVHRIDKWLNACGVGCNAFENGDAPFNSPADNAACEEECYGGGNEGEIEQMGTFCETHPSNLGCIIYNYTSNLSVKDLLDIKRLICEVKPSLGMCSNVEPSGCANGEVLCIKNGTTQCSLLSDCDDDDDIIDDIEDKNPTNWGMIAAIGGGVVLLGLVAVLVLKKK